MDESLEVQVVEAELVEPPSLPERLADGRFGPNNPGRPKGSLNRVAKEMKEALAREIEKGGDNSNPLIILLRVAASKEATDAVKISAADRLLRYLLPQLSQVELPNADPEFEIATATIKARLRGLFLPSPTEAPDGNG